MQHSLEESPELLLQFDGANDSDVERPGKVEVVTGNEPDEGEKDGGGWVVVGTQRKTREEPSRMVEVEKKEGRTGRLVRQYPSLLKLHDWKYDILERLEAEIGEEELKEEEKWYEISGVYIARSARGCSFK